MLDKLTEESLREVVNELRAKTDEETIAKIPVACMIDCHLETLLDSAESIPESQGLVLMNVGLDILANRDEAERYLAGLLGYV